MFRSFKTRFIESVEKVVQTVVESAKKACPPVKVFFTKNSDQAQQSFSHSAREHSEQETKEKAQSNARKTSSPIVETTRIAAVTKEGQDVSQEITSSARQNLVNDIGYIAKRMVKGWKIRLSTEYLTLKKAIYQLFNKAFKSDKYWSAIDFLKEMNRLAESRGLDLLHTIGDALLHSVSEIRLGIQLIIFESRILFQPNSMTMLDRGRIYASKAIVLLGNYSVASIVKTSAIAIGSFLFPVWGALAGVIIAGVLASYLKIGNHIIL